MSLFKVVVEKFARSMSQQLSYLLVFIELVRFVTRHSMILDVMAQLAIREQEEVIVILKT